MRPTRRRITSACLTCATLLAGAALPGLLAAPATAATARSVVPDTHPAWAVAAAAVGSAPAAKPIRARVYLAPRDQAGLDRAVAAVSTPGSPSYRLYLTPAQFRARYAATSAAVGQVDTWLRSAGLTVSAPRQNGRFVEVTGPVAAAERAFGTGLALYRHAGGTYQAPVGAVTVPTGVTPYVLTVTGLDESPARVAPKNLTGASIQRARSTVPTVYPPGFRNANPCSLWYGQFKASYQKGGTVPLPAFAGQVLKYSVCGYRPNQLRSAYGAPSALTGKGATVAIVDAFLSPTLVADANRYASRSGGVALAAGQLQILQPTVGYTNQDACYAPGWYGEQSLDVEAVHGFAPGANVIYAAAASCNGLDLFDAEVGVVDDNRASIVSMSFGNVEGVLSPGEAAAENALFKQGALQGIGFYVASGDNGDEVANSGMKQVDTPASSPYVTAVGGTSLAIGPSGQYWFETGWGTHVYFLSPDQTKWFEPGFAYGAGGGFSAMFARPSYQNGVVYANAPAGRAVPDVGMLADPTTGMMIGETQQFPDGAYYDEYRVGGTSLAAPLFAAAQALTSQAQHVRLGFANPRIYALAKQALTAPAASKAFHDVTPAFDSEANVRTDYLDGLSAANGLLYTVRTFDDDTSIATRKGWDDVTGVGSPTAAYYTASGVG